MRFRKLFSIGITCILLIVCSACQKQTTPPPPLPFPPRPEVYYFTFAGTLEDQSGIPLKGLEITAQTRRGSETVYTDAEGFFVINVVQGSAEHTRFTFVNAIGDEVFIQKRFTPDVPAKIRFMMDNKGSVHLLKPIQAALDREDPQSPE